MLIDSGNSHKFIDIGITKRLNMFDYPSSFLQVTIPGNKTTLCMGKCHKVKLSINYYQLQSTMYAMEIMGVDVELGSQWLSPVGTIGLQL